MRRSTRAISMGAAIGLALIAGRGRAGVEPVVAPSAHSEASRGIEAPAYLAAEPWFSPPSLDDPSLVPPMTPSPYQSPAVHPTASPAVPLPPAAWTGLSGLATLGALSLLRRLRRRR